MAGSHDIQACAVPSPWEGGTRPARPGPLLWAPHLQVWAGCVRPPLPQLGPSGSCSCCSSSLGWPPAQLFQDPPPLGAPGPCPSPQAPALFLAGVPQSWHPPWSSDLELQLHNAHTWTRTTHTVGAGEGLTRLAGEPLPRPSPAHCPLLYLLQLPEAGGPLSCPRGTQSPVGHPLPPERLWVRGPLRGHGPRRGSQGARGQCHHKDPSLVQEVAVQASALGHRSLLGAAGLGLCGSVDSFTKWPAVSIPVSSGTRGLEWQWGKGGLTTRGRVAG